MGIAIAVLLVAFIFMFLLLGIFSRSEHWIRNTIVKSSLTFSATLIVITELAGLFKQLNFAFVLFSWLVISIALGCALYFFRDERKLFVNHIRLSLQTFLKAKKGKPTFYILLSLLLLVFIQGLVNPPNNWDSMTYHLSRIVAWIGQQSLAHFPTHIQRQVYQPPFAEFVVLHINLLSGGDYFANSSQFLFLLLCFPALLSLLDEMGIKKYSTRRVAFLLFTIPIVVLQASSTQNDIVFSFFILSATRFALKAYRENSFTNYLYFGLSVGLAMLTKGTAYIYLAPVILIYGIAILLKSYTFKNFSFIGFSILAALLAISLNSGQFYRNHQLSGHILGISEKENSRYVNQEINAGVVVSNSIKNISLHFGPYPLSRISQVGVAKLLKSFGLDADDPGTNWLDEPFIGASDFPSQEDTAPNFLHFLLIFTSIVFIAILWMKRRISMDGKMLLLILTLAVQILLFSGYLRWQPWHSRLHSAGFMLSIPLILYACPINALFARLVKIVIPIMVFYAFFVVIFNNSRPFLSVPPFTRDISVMDSRDKKFYANKVFLFDEYEPIKKEITRKNFKIIGLIIGNEDWEYPLFRDVYTHPLQPVHIMVDNITASAPPSAESVDCIVSTIMNTEFIDYKEKRYVNQSPGNKYAWLYYVEE